MNTPERAPSFSEWACSLLATLTVAMGGVLLSVPAVGVAAPPVRIYAAGQGSAFLPYARGLSAYLGAHGIETTVVQTAGSIENIRSVYRDSESIGTVFMGSAFEAYTGIGDWNDGTRFTDLRALFPMYETSFAVAAMVSSGIHGVTDLDGKRVGVGPRGGPAAVYFAGLADAIHLQTTPVYGQPAELVDALLSGKIEALWQGAPAPIPALVDVVNRAPAVVFGLTEAQQSAMAARFTFLARTTVAAQTYAGQSVPMLSVGAWNFVLAHKDFSVDDAYRITRAALSAADLSQPIGPSAVGTRAENAATNSFMPFHPGAARYYREHAVSVIN